jgi:DNA polymerase-1
MTLQGKLVLVDGNSLLYRTYYALPSLVTREGIPTGGVFGFTTILLKLLEEEKPDYIAFTFDLKGPTFRHVEYAGYKATRPKAPSDLIQQVALAHELAEAFRVPVFEVPGYEADDVIATLASRAAAEGLEVLILTGDLDTLQLVSGQVTVLHPRRGISETVRYTPAAVRERFRLEPSQMVDYKALVGDPSDNLPRVAGIGEKTAQVLLAKYGTLEGTYHHLDEIEGRTRRALEGQRQQAEQNKALTRLVCDLPFEVDWGRLLFRGLDPERGRALFKRLEFMTLLTKLLAPEDQPEGTLSILPWDKWTGDEVAQAVFFLPGNPPALAWSRGGIAWTGELEPTSGELSLFQSPRFLPLKVEAWLADPTLDKWTHDWKETYKALRHADLTARGFRFDTMLASYLANSGRTSHHLGQVFLEKTKQSLPEGPEKPARERAAWGAWAVEQLKPLLEEDLRQLDLLDLLRDLEMPLAEVLAEMEIEGIRLSRQVLDDLRHQAESRLNVLEEEITSLCGCQFNLSSPKQLAFVLYEKLQLAKGRRIKTGYSTDAATLESLVGAHPAVAKLLEHRELFKLKTTYIDSLPSLMDRDGRVHTTYQQTSASTGRITSMNPNLQNIPIRSPFGQQIRKAFLASSDHHSLLSADYSQIELRILAHLSEDQDLLETFEAGGDIHTDTACHIFHVSPSEITKEMRRKAKAVNFGIIYGMSSFGLSQSIGVLVEEAQAYIEAYFASHTAVRGFLEGILLQGRVQGYVSTLLGRKRFLPDLTSRNHRLAQAAERMALNAPIQGSAADILKLAMRDLFRAIEQAGLRSRMVLTVHDELVLDCPLDEVDTVAPMVRRAMEGALSLRVPLKVEMKVGPNWGEMVSLCPSCPK